jgi:N-acetylneuraminic acid mutarotase
MNSDFSHVESDIEGLHRTRVVIGQFPAWPCGATTERHGTAHAQAFLSFNLLDVVSSAFYMRKRTMMCLAGWLIASCGISKATQTLSQIHSAINQIPLDSRMQYLQLLAVFSLLDSALSLPSPPKKHDHQPTWRTLAPTPLGARQEHTTLFLPPSTIAILGGIVPTNDASLVWATTSLMQFYSISTNTWTTKASIPIPLNHLNAAVVDGKVYLLGGLAEESSRGRAWRAIASSWVYSPSTDSWVSLPNVPSNQLRGSAAVGVYDKKIYLAGGVTDLELYGNSTQRTVSVVSIFDTVTQKWLDVPQAAKNLPEGRDHAGAAVVGDKMYVLGGRNNGQGNIKDTVFLLDLCDVKAGWKISEAKMPTARGGVAAGVIGRKVYTFGGEGNKEVESGVFDQVEAYDTVKDTWERVGTMKVPRHGTYAVGVRGKVYIPGGGIVQGGGPVADFDVFEP